MANLKPHDLALVLYRLTDGLSDEEAAKATAQFVKAMTRRGLASQLSRVAQEFGRIHDSQSGLSSVLVEGVTEPKASELAGALKALGLSARNAVVRFVANPDLVGGIRVRSEDKIVDLSVRRRLSDLRESLALKSAE